MFENKGYLRSPLFIVCFLLICFCVFEAIQLFMDTDNFNALKRVFAIVGLLVLIGLDYWLREAKLSNGTKFFVQMIVAVPLFINFLYPVSNKFYGKYILNKIYYQTNVILHNKPTEDFFVILWENSKGKDLIKKIINKNQSQLTFEIKDSISVLSFKEKQDPSFFADVEYSYQINDSTYSKGSVETEYNPDHHTSPFLIGKTKYNYQVFKFIYDSNNEPYLIREINFDTDKTTMRKAVERLNSVLTNQN